MRDIVLVSLALVGCTDSATPDPAPGDQPPGQAPADQPRLVTVGGRVLASPKIRPVFFQADAGARADIEGFLGELAASAYWPQVAAEYGVGAPAVLPTIVSTDAPPAGDVELEAWLRTNLDGSHADWGALDEDAIYSVFLPPGVVFKAGFGDSCDEFGAYHGEAAGAGGKHLVYALMPRCTAATDALTAAFTHELLEAATDPDVSSKPAYGAVDADHAIWAFRPGAEVADFCEFLPLGGVRVGNRAVPRMWSNTEAAAGNDPCVPAPSPYASATPVLTDSLTLAAPGQQVSTLGVAVPIGESKTIDIALRTDSAGEITVVAHDAAKVYGDEPELEVSLDRPSGRSGDVLQLTIKRLRAGEYAGSEFLVATKVAGNLASTWWGFAGN